MADFNINEKVREFTSRFEGVASIVGSYIESSIGDKEKIDRNIKGFLQGMERMVKEVIQQKIHDHLNKEVVLKVKKLENFKGELPKYQSPLASGFDVRAQVHEKIVLNPGERVLIPTGLSFEIPEGYEIQARPRSGLAIKEGVGLVNSPGTIDADYRGEVKIIVINYGQSQVTINDQDRIAQLVVAPVVQATFSVTQNLSDTDRGAGGFGSTGKSDVPMAKSAEVSEQTELSFEESEASEAKKMASKTQEKTKSPSATAAKNKKVSERKKATTAKNRSK